MGVTVPFSFFFWGGGEGWENGADTEKYPSSLG